MKNGYIKVAAITPDLAVADCKYNAKNSIDAIKKAHADGVKLLCLPELGLTGATCGDLFFSKTLIDGAKNALLSVLEETKDLEILYTLGLPFAYQGKLYNCAAVCYKGQIWGLVPKTKYAVKTLPFEERYFEFADKDFRGVCNFGNDIYPSVSTDYSLELNVFNGVKIGVFVGAMGAPMERAADIVLNPVAIPEKIGATKQYENTLACASKLLSCAFVCANTGVDESTSSVVFGGQGLVVENGVVLASNKPFGAGVVISEIDTEILISETEKNDTVATDIQFVTAIHMKKADTTLTRHVPKRPFIPENKDELALRCREIVDIQAYALAKRVRHIKGTKAVIGISGGLDSTLALLITARAFDIENRDRKDIVCVTMPGFGTTSRTKSNAEILCNELGVTFRTVSIAKAVLGHFEDIGHDPAKTDVTYENAQARERTQILMDISNEVGGIVIGTGDLSELALGWATYNGDHMSMYGVNASVPKTMIRHLVNWFAVETDNEDMKKTLFDILDTPVSPELLPPTDTGNIAQKTEDLVGPYDLHDFYLYYHLRYGFSPAKIYRLAVYAWEGIYDAETIKKWLKIFFRRFFTQQFKRSCMPDGPSVGSVSVSPAGGLMMPSDAVSALWLAEIDEL